MLAIILSIILWKPISFQVKASIIATEAAQVQKGIVDLVNKHGIKKLVMGAETEKYLLHFYGQFVQHKLGVPLVSVHVIRSSNFKIFGCLFKFAE